MNFEQINGTTFKTRFSGLDDMGKVAMEGISFFNNTFDVLVKEANCEWDEHKVTFILREESYSAEDVEVRLRGSKNSVEWQERGYKILWKKANTAESYHTASSVEELKRQYKNSVACMCNHKEGKYEIESIIAT